MRSDIAWQKSSYSGGGGEQCVEISAVPWQKSSHSGGGEQCVEISAHPHTIAIRESDIPTVVVTTTPPRFRALIASVRGRA
ncbi:DUF397 domain-containing protein [Streptomyces luteoverticillatus]|uniref:DUF397 domain-containing protein n=1 Tax=Streptomyces luteoverticillatus TaxID=66425 RepID=A0A3S9PJU3_STRLT|nr:DUF397 domain-containing protein [Streptomyces luteoverticillatus]AZQ72615.1 DUF397 domain-containing protein [Streptomyces luteoverticillatus]